MQMFPFEIYRRPPTATPQTLSTNPTNTRVKILCSKLMG